jgi:hypothetical protein
MGSVGYPESPVNKYHFTLCNIPEEYVNYSV